MKKILLWPYRVYEWLFFMPMVGVVTVAAGFLTAIFSVLVNPRFASRTFAVRWARILAWFTPMKVTVCGAEHIDHKRTYVVICNHQSQYDILVAYGWLDLDLKFVIKQELRRVPGIGIGCEKAGHIFVDRKNPRKAQAAVKEALARLQEGVGILFFAEGTRSLDGSLQRFKKGAFRLAIEQQLPILPVTLIGTREILPAKSLRLYPGRATLLIHPAIETAGMSKEHENALLERTHEVVASGLSAQVE